MVSLLPPELIGIVQQKCPCREVELRQLAAFYNSLFPSPPILVAYGLEHSAKREVITAILSERDIPHAVIEGQECLSQRHLLSKIFAACLTALGQDDEIEQYERMDNLNTLLGNLRRLFEKMESKKFVAVIDQADVLRQPGATLLPALARLGDLIPGFSIILTSKSPRPLKLHRAGIPYIHFPPYTRSEAISIITSRMKWPTTSHSQGLNSVTSDETKLRKLYPQFAATVYDSLISSTSSTSILTFQSACDKLWPRFIEPLVSAQETTGKEKSWHFGRLLVLNRSLFQSEGEGALHNPLTKKSPRSTHDTTTLLPSDLAIKRAPLLKHFPTLVLLSAFLASHTQPKHDILIFSRMSSRSSSKKIRRLRQTPTKRKSTSSANTTPTRGDGTPTKARAKSIFSANANLGIPRPFTLERLVAIVRIVHPHGIPSGSGRGVSDRIYRELGELEKLRLVVRASGSSSLLAIGEDTMDEKWRVNVGRDWVVDMGKSWGMQVSEYEIDQDF